MIVQRAIFEKIKEHLPDFNNYCSSVISDPMKGTVNFTEFNNSVENVGIALRGSKPKQTMNDNHIYLRSMVGVMNYSTADVEEGYRFGNDCLTALTSILFEDCFETVGTSVVKVCNLNSIDIESDVNFLGKNSETALNMFSINMTIHLSL